MKDLIKKFNALKEQSATKAVTSRLLEDVNNACILARTVDNINDNSTHLFDGFVLKVYDCFSELIDVIEQYEQSEKNSEVPDEKA